VLAVTSAGFVKRWKICGPDRPRRHSWSWARINSATLSSECSKVLAEQELVPVDCPQKVETRMVCGPQEETSEQAVNRSLLLRAMQTAIGRGLRARNEPPEELPLELTVLLERLKEQRQE
jgi:hypothetical protein